MNRSKIMALAIYTVSGLAVPTIGTSQAVTITIPQGQYTIQLPVPVQDMKNGINALGYTRVPEDANSGQKLYLNPSNNAFMLCALIDETTDTCLRFYTK